jgi:hypothetical protein
VKSCSPAALDICPSFVFWEILRGAWCGKISETYCLSTFSTLLVGPKIQDTFSEQLGRQGIETENGKPGARETYLTGRITGEIYVQEQTQEQTPRKALSGYLCAERGVRIGGCVAIQREESGPSCPFSFLVSSSLVAAAKGPSASFPPNS